MSAANSDALIRTLLSPALLASNAYHVPDRQGLIQLDAMENPYPLPDALRAEWLASLGQAALNRYPDPRPQVLMDTLKTRLGLAPDLDLMLGNGSDELLQLLIIAVAGTRRPILAPEPSFAMYRILTEHLGLPFVGVPLGLLGQS
ncbi:MAG: aminotransferase class I/II-fold pyridoxal phosphate-dependent enzyme, partial [Gammaproteobacteria bacterium]|nr:aminotransferase class I/II-fold pyridoxal phosphate-dependent enzyme [Gammaproteobacteria bacterium]